MYIYMCVYIYMYMCIHVYICVYMCVCINIYVYVYTCVYIYMYLYIFFIYMYSCARRGVSSDISDGLANEVLVKNRRASPTTFESLAANFLFRVDDRIVIAHLFVSQDPHETKKHGMNSASNWHNAMMAGVNTVPTTAKSWRCFLILTPPRP